MTGKEKFQKMLDSEKVFRKYGDYCFVEVIKNFISNNTTSEQNMIATVIVLLFYFQCLNTISKSTMKAWKMNIVFRLLVFTILL